MEQRRLPGFVWALALLAAMSGSATAAMSDGVVRVLVLTNLSGTYSDFTGQGSVAAAEMAAEALGRTVGGTPVEVLTRDSELDPDIAVRRLRETHAKTPVDMVVGLSASNTALAVQQFAEKHGIVTLHSAPSSTAFNDENCSPLAVQWGFNTHALAQSVATSLVDRGAHRWYFVTADYSFGHDLRDQVAAVVTANGGEVVGESVIPSPAGAEAMADAVNEAAASPADVLGLANAGEDTQLALRQSYAQGLHMRDIAPVAIEFYITDVRSLGVYVTTGLRFATSFYWNRDARAREWSQRFRRRHGSPPTSPQAGVYSATRHYLEAVAAAGTDDGKRVMAAMRTRPVDDGVFTADGRVLMNSRMLHDMLLVEVKQPMDIKRTGDYLEVLQTVPRDTAFRAPRETECPLTAGS